MNYPARLVSFHRTDATHEIGEYHHVHESIVHAMMHRVRRFDGECALVTKLSHAASRDVKMVRS